MEAPTPVLPARVSEVAAVDEDQVGHDAHLRRLGCRQEQPVVEHQARHRLRRVVVFEVHHAVGGQVEHAPGPAVQLREDRPGRRALVDQRHHLKVAATEQVGHCACLFARPGQRREPRVDHRRVADDERRGLGAVRHARAPRRREQLPHHAAGYRQRLRARVEAVLQEFPGQGRGSRVHQNRQLAPVRRVCLEVVGHQQLEQRAAEVVARLGGAERLVHERLDHAPLRGPQRGAGPGGISHGLEPQRPVLVGRDAKALPPRPVGRVPRPPLPFTARHEQVLERHALELRRPREATQGVHGVDGAVLVELEDVEPVDLHDEALRHGTTSRARFSLPQPPIGRRDGPHQRLDDVGEREPAFAGTDQQRRQRRRDGAADIRGPPFALALAALPAGTVGRVHRHRLRQGARQSPRRQVAHRSEARDDGARCAGIARGRVVHDHDGGADGARVDIDLQQFRQASLQATVQVRLGRDDDVVLVVADEHRMPRVGEVVVEHAHADRRPGGAGGGGRLRVPAERGGRQLVLVRHHGRHGLAQVDTSSVSRRAGGVAGSSAVWPFASRSARAAGAAGHSPGRRGPHPCNRCESGRDAAVPGHATVASLPLPSPSRNGPPPRSRRSRRRTVSGRRCRRHRRRAPGSSGVWRTIRASARARASDAAAGTPQREAGRGSEATLPLPSPGALGASCWSSRSHAGSNRSSPLPFRPGLGSRSSTPSKPAMTPSS